MVTAPLDPLLVLDTGRSTRGWSYYGRWSECHRLWAFDNLYPPAAHAPQNARGASLGTLEHALLARHYLIELGFTQPTVEQIVSENSKGMDPEDVNLGLTRYAQYVARFAVDEWTPLHVEQEYMVGVKRDRNLPGNGPATVRVVPAHTPGSALYTSRLDLVVLWNDKVWIVDHKTGARVGREAGLDYSMSGQVHGFYHLGRFHFGDRFGGVLLNFIQTHAGVKFKRKQPHPAPDMVQRHPWTVLAIASEIELWTRNVQAQAAAEGRQPTGWDFRSASSPSICVSKWGACPYLTHCRWGE
jgi:hypothetical protein